MVFKASGLHIKTVRRYGPQEFNFSIEKAWNLQKTRKKGKIKKAENKKKEVEGIVNPIMSSLYAQNNPGGEMPNTQPTDPEPDNGPQVEEVD